MSHTSLTSFGTVSTGTPAVVDVNGRHGVTVSVFPGAGSSVLVEASTTENAASRSDANWIAWTQGTNGVVTSSAMDTFLGALFAVRITVVAGSSVSSYEVTAI